ncbi:hypothetical protein PR003_g15380 [Phytophthora rubi]|nr:hypothetical protein PR002_g22082 [Phytophthora rubi]KAE9330187.1 hypothetical protein PR003_g15380 [Phytophthora rubi]
MPLSKSSVSFGYLGGGLNYCAEFYMKMGEYVGAIFTLLFYVFLLGVKAYLLEYHWYLAPTNIQLLPKGYALAKSKHKEDPNSETGG